MKMFIIRENDCVMKNVNFITCIFWKIYCKFKNYRYEIIK